MTAHKVDLTLLKRLVSELEGALANADGIKIGASPDKNNYLVELSKAIGFATGIMGETGALMGDISYLIQGGPSKSTSGSQAEFLEKLLGPFKGPGNAN